MFGLELRRKDNATQTAFNFRWFDKFQGDKINAINKGKTKNDGYLSFKDTRYKKKLKEIK